MIIHVDIQKNEQGLHRATVRGLDGVFAEAESAERAFSFIKPQLFFWVSEQLVAGKFSDTLSVMLVPHLVGVPEVKTEPAEEVKADV